MVNEYLDQIQIEKLESPPYSIDLNRIEFMCDILKRRIGGCTRGCNAIHQKTIQNFLGSMPRRMQAFLGTRGQNMLLRFLVRSNY